MEPKEKLQAMLETALTERSLKKIVLSKPTEETVLRTECRRIRDARQGELLCLETFYTDGKAKQRNIAPDEAAEAVLALFAAAYRQLDLITTGGNAEAKIAKSGKWVVTGAVKTGEAVEATSHNKEKHYIFPENQPCGFLRYLGISDPNGRVYDKKQAKFRQINRFVEHVRDILPYLPAEGPLRVLDLCCGKSYLSFAVYAYLTEQCHREVRMLGADLKPDVIAYCEETARALGYTGLTFVCTDIAALETEPPDLVLSLHACDIATDIVLRTAAAQKAKVILSTPCCQHELFQRYDRSRAGFAALEGLTEQSMIRQKLCEGITDALRCLYLESEGYEVTAAELIDPEDTPKNLLIRAVRKKRIHGTELIAKKEAYERLRDSFYGAAGGIR